MVQRLGDEWASVQAECWAEAQAKKCNACEKAHDAAIKAAFKRGEAMKPHPDGVYQNGYYDGGVDGKFEVFKWLFAAGYLTLPLKGDLPEKIQEWLSPQALKELGIEAKGG